MRSETGHFDPEILDLFIRRLDLAKELWSTYHPEAVARVAAVPPPGVTRA